MPRSRYGWTHPKGGWQGGRGWEDTDHTPQTAEYFGGGGGWHIENFFEALDEANEWFLDTQKQTLHVLHSTLYTHYIYTICTRACMA